ncbi:hypothetical protein T4D_6150 [Trichinella pseudospiralis]|uniref:Uncharacterized protein n=1 Tax=Trichinella pseudospiralis TaxID=6337 RepID=A0A0V1F3Z1_TRIPS|nr:hypothetical protein T4D_6150 [Trichinella pseudospiralis]
MDSKTPICSLSHGCANWHTDGGNYIIEDCIQMRDLSLNQPLCWVAFNSQRHYRKVAEKKFEDLQGGFEHLRNTTKMKLGNLIHETNQVGQLLNVVRDVHFESEAAEKQQILILLNDRRAVRSGFNGRK